MPSADFCVAIRRPCDLLSRSSYASVGFDTTQTSRGKSDNLPRTTAESTATVLDGSGLRHQWLARPTVSASYPVLVHRLACSLHASFRPRLATTPLRFTFLRLHQARTGTSTPQTIKHARHTIKKRPREMSLSSVVRLVFEFVEPITSRGFPAFLPG